MLAGCSFTPGRITGPSDGDADVRDSGDLDVAVDDAPGDAAADGVTGDATFTCPSGYVAAGTAQYRYAPSNTGNFNAARGDCENDDDAGTFTGFTHLVVLSGETERAQLATFVAGIDDQKVWIGVTDRVLDGTWRWVTAEPIVGYPPASGTPWKSGEPNDDGDCVQMLSGSVHELEDRPCTSDNERYVCECDAYAEDPTSY